MSSLPKIAITAGDPAGIGPEIVVKALASGSAVYDVCTPIVIGDSNVLENATRQFGVGKNIPAEIISCEVLAELPQMGEVNSSCGAASVCYVERAIELANEGVVDAVATAPINKESLKAAGVPYTDHTAIFETKTKSADVMTMFVTGSLRIFFYSRHIAFKDIVSALTVEGISNALIACQKHLQKLGIAEPKIALAALNPHAGEQGLFGDEEGRILEPAVALARGSGVNAFGPIGADSVFYQTRQGQYDAVLSLYHDQGHIAAKTLDFHGTVSVTVGLPFIRTSVDHGTAFDIAGKGVAEEQGLINATQLAAEYASVEV